MKHFLIKYQFKSGSPEEWHQQIVRFIAALDSAPELKGRISYRVMKEKDSPCYYHLAAATDSGAINALQSAAFFKPYQEETRRVAGGEVTVVPLELIAGASFQA